MPTHLSRILRKCRGMAEPNLYYAKPSLQRNVKEHAGKPPKTPKRCPGGQPAPRSGSEAARVWEDIIVRTRHFLSGKACCADRKNRCAVFAGCKRATCSPFPMAQCVRTNRPHAEICSIEGLFSTPSRSTFKPTHGTIPPARRSAAAAPCSDWRIQTNVCRATVGEE